MSTVHICFIPVQDRLPASGKKIRFENTIRTDTIYCIVALEKRIREIRRKLYLLPGQFSCIDVDLLDCPLDHDSFFVLRRSEKHHIDLPVNNKNTFT